jgi:hypothetical protein
MGVSGQHHAPAALYPRGKNPGTHLTGGWVGPEPVWTQRLEEKSSAYVGDRAPVVQSVVRHYTVWATPAPKLVCSFVIFEYNRIKTCNFMCNFVLGLPHLGKNSDWGCLRSGYWEHYFDQRERKKYGNGWQCIHNEELHTWHSSPNIIKIIKSSKMAWRGHKARMGRWEMCTKRLVGKTEWKTPLVRPRKR